MISISRAGALARPALVLTGLAVALLAAFENTGLDLRIASIFYDPASHGFPAQHQAFFEIFLHHGLKTASYAAGVIALGVCFLGWRGELAWLPRRNALLAALGMILIPLVIATLKHLTNRHCPWDVIEFGGYAPYFGLFASPPDDLARGVCFPAGHAAAGFAWLAWAPALWTVAPRAARVTLVAALAAGFLLGLARMAQGAHFASHVLWSAWLAAAISLVLAALLRVPLQASAPPATRPGSAPRQGAASDRR